MRGFLNRYAKKAAAHLPELGKYETKPRIAHDERLSDEKQKS